MLLGCRVVRGPDWKIEQEDHDGGEGFVGTITSLESFPDGSALPKETVLVCWDTGFLACYRAGQDGCYDLRILDSASTGVKFTGYSCSGCKESCITGMRWHCAVCPNYDLCTLCYMDDVHETMNHGFFRFDTCSDSTNGVDVGQRSTSTKIQSKGIFPGAIVKTGKDWTSESLGNGVVLELASWENMPRSAAMVDWENFCELLLRVGYKGKVDLELHKFSHGPTYYKEHLPKVSLYDMTVQEQSFSFSDKQVQHNSGKESTIQSTIKEAQQKELKDKLTQRFEKQKPSENTTAVKDKPPPPRTLPKPSQRPRNDDNPSKNDVGKSETKSDQTPTEPVRGVKDMVKMLSQGTEGGSTGRRKAPAPPRSVSRVDPSQSNTLPKTSKKSRPAPSPPRPHSTILEGSDGMSPGLLEKKEAPSRTHVTSLAANLCNVLNLDPTRSHMPLKKPPVRELICTTCDKKASKVIFEPCGDSTDIYCPVCAWKLKRCLKCNEPIDRKTTPDGLPLEEPDNEMANLKKQLEEIKREVECPICMEDRSNILFNCGHKTCKVCSDEISQQNNLCPFCKQYITERKLMY